MAIPRVIEFEQRTTDPTETVPPGELWLYSLGAAVKVKTDSQNIFTLSTGVTPEEVEDIVANLLQPGTGIDLNYNDGANTLTISIDSTTLSTINSALQSGDNISELVNDSGYQLAADVAASIAAHEALPDPHPQYLTQPEADAIYYPLTNPSDYQDPVQVQVIAAAAASAAVVAHEALGDPHPQYLTQPEGDALYYSVSNPDNYQNPAQVQVIAAGEASSAVTAHEGLPDPHPQYTTTAEASAAAPVQSVNSQTGNVVVGFTKRVSFDLSVVSFTNNFPTFSTVYTYNTPSLPIGTYIVKAFITYEPGATNNNDLFRLAESGTQLPTQIDHDDEGKDTGGDIKRPTTIVGELIVSAAGSQNLTLEGAQRGGGTTVVKGIAWEVEQFA